MVILATLIDQWIGFGLIVFFAGWVCADATRPKVRRTRRTR